MKNYLKSPIVFLPIIVLIILCMAATDPIRHVIVLGGTNVYVSTGTTNANTYFTVNRSGSSITNLNDLADVDGTPNDGDVLTYNFGTGIWGPVAPTAGSGTGITTNFGSGTNNIFVGPTNISGLSISNALVDTITTNRVALRTNSVASIGWVEGVSNTLNGKISTGGIAVTDGVGTNTFITNALLANPNITNGILVTPSMTNGVNYGQAFRSKGAGLESLQLGPSASANGEASIAIGSSAEADNLDSIAIGPQATAQYNTSVAIGAGVVTTAAGEIRIGISTNTVAIPGTMSIGDLNVSTLTVTNPSTLVLTNTYAKYLTSSNRVANLEDATNAIVGYRNNTNLISWSQTDMGSHSNALASTLTNQLHADIVNYAITKTNGVNYGNAFSSPGAGATSEAFGGGPAAATGDDTLAVGNASWAYAPRSIALGSAATTKLSSVNTGGTNSVAIGYNAQATNNNAFALGASVRTTYDGEYRIGQSSNTVVVGNLSPVQTQYAISSLGYTNGVATNGYVIDFDKPEYELTATTTNDTMFLITSNRLANLVRYTTISIYAVSNIDFAFNESWVWLGTTNNPPTALNAGKYGILTLRCNGTATNNVTAVFSGQ